MRALGASLIGIAILLLVVKALAHLGGPVYWLGIVALFVGIVMFGVGDRRTGGRTDL